MPDGVTVQDLLELSSETTKKAAYDEVWLSIFARRLDLATLERCCRGLGVPKDRALSGSRTANANEGSLLLGHSIAYSKRHDGLVLYNCNTDESFGEESFAEDGAKEAGAFGSYARLDQTDGEQGWEPIVDELDQLMAVSEKRNSSTAETLRLLVRPLVGYLRTYRRMLLRLTPDLPVGARPGELNALRRFVLSKEMGRLAALRDALEEEVKELDIVRTSMAFFQFGADSMGALARMRGRTRREGLSATLAWWAAYYLAAAREYTKMGLHSNALLHLCRAFETYVLAYLWRRGGVDVDERSGRFVLSGGEDPGMANLWRVMRQEAPDVARRFGDRFYRVKDSRNANLLIHGFNIPDASVVSAARKLVMELIGSWEGRLAGDAKVMRGRVVPMYRGGVRGPTIGRTLAAAVVARSRARWTN